MCFNYSIMKFLYFMSLIAFALMNLIWGNMPADASGPLWVQAIAIFAPLILLTVWGVKLFKKR